MGSVNIKCKKDFTSKQVATELFNKEHAAQILLRFQFSFGWFESKYLIANFKKQSWCQMVEFQGSYSFIV